LSQQLTRNWPTGEFDQHVQPNKSFAAENVDQTLVLVQTNFSQISSLKQQLVFVKRKSKHLEN
jgi:hypothetical protein